MRASATPRKSAAMRSWIIRMPEDELELEFVDVDDAWDEEGSDRLMDFDVLVRIRQIAQLVEIERARRIARRGE